MAFGPAEPSATKSLMGGADVAVVGFSDATADSAFIRDFHLRDYLPCRVDGGTVVGACADAVWAGAGWNASLSASETAALAASVDNWALAGASVAADGVTTIRFRRDVVTADARFDVPMAPSQPRSFVWARGETFELTATGDGDGAPRADPAAVDVIKYHGATEGVGYGVLNNLTLDERVDGCADDSLAAASSPSAAAGEALQGVGVKSVELVGGGVTVSWKIVDGAKAVVRVAARRAGNWASLGIGALMSDSFSYVGHWDPAAGAGAVTAYVLSGYTAADVTLAPASEQPSDVSVAVSGGVVSFGFTVPADKFNVAAAAPSPSSSSSSAAATSAPQPTAGKTLLSWAVGPRWTSLADTDAVAPAMEHSFFSRVATEVDFATGAAAAAAPRMDARLQAHAWLTFVAWLVMVPAAAYVARGMKHALGFPGKKRTRDSQRGKKKKTTAHTHENATIYRWYTNQSHRRVVWYVPAHFFFQRSRRVITKRRGATRGSMSQGGCARTWR